MDNNTEINAGSAFRSEDDRLERLRAYDILDTPPEENFDRLTLLASHLLNMPVAAVSLIDAHRQWFKSSVGLGMRETPRDQAFCAHSMLGDTIMEIPDATQDPRFVNTPLVTGDPGIRFYAGAPLKTPDGVSLGSLCVVDTRPRRLTPAQRMILTDLAALVGDALEARLALKKASERERDLRLAHAARHLGEERHRAVIDSANDAIVTIDSKGIVRSANPACERIFGWSPHELIGADVRRLMPTDVAADHDRHIAHYEETGTAGIIGIGREVMGLRRDGTRFPLDISISEAMTPEGGRLYTGIMRDISDRRRTEDLLEDRTRTLKLAERVAGLGHWRMDIATGTFDWSDGLYRIYGLSRDETPPTLDTLFIHGHPGDRKLLEDVLPRAETATEPFCVQRRIVRQDGEERALATTVCPERDEHGRLVALFGVTQDVTGQVRTERELREKQELLDKATRFANVGTWEIDLQSRELTFSDQAAALFGDDRGATRVPASHFFSYLHPDDRPRVRQAVGYCLEGAEYDIEYRIFRRDGTLRWMHACGSVESDASDGPAHLVGIITDITRRKEAELALAESRRQLEVAIENITDGFLLLDEEDRVVLSNGRARDLMPGSGGDGNRGITFAEVVRRGVASGFYPDAEGCEEDFIADRLARHRQPDETGEIRVRNRDGAVRWIRIGERALPCGGRVGIRTDITELKEAREEADRANSAKSEFLSAMSHELRTPLNAILGFAQVLEGSRRDPLNDRQKSHVQQILKGGRHLLELINEVLDLARIEAGKMNLSIETVRVADVLEHCVPVAETLAARRGITVTVEAEEAPAVVRADLTRLNQVILNLLSNGVKYNRENGTLTLSVSATQEGTARFAVTDTGPGIPPENMERLFRPFDRLGAEATEIEGTGIGLSLTRELVERMDGSIAVRSTVGVGSTFSVDIPMPEEAVLDGARRAGKTRAWSAGPTSLRVLYVEDNPANMALMQEVMAEYDGVELLTAHNAELGLEIARSENVQLIILDINLPGMDGYRALDAIRAEPALAFVATMALSADATAGAMRRGLEAGFDAYLTKPVVISSLMEAIDMALGRAESSPYTRRKS
ncbi:PAS domain S-box protein [Caenispirillum salinarum]|uniref:hybrid sensor histidine kinase/response regulator n=1 Tax=Caenispirillum salinarum TaxID=859058 RepID=UPI0038517760